MAVLRDIHNNCLFPAEEEIARPCPCRHSYAEVSVVRHEDQHEEVTDHDLNDVQYGLQEVREAQHLLSENTKPKEQSASMRHGRENAHPQRENVALRLTGCQGGDEMAEKTRKQAGHRLLHASVTCHCAFPHRAGW